MVISCAFTNVGQAFLSDSAAWMTPAIVRSAKIHQVPGGWSRLLAVFLHHLLKGPLGISTVGVPVELDQGTVLIYANLGALLTDGEGWQVCYDWRGHASLKPCFKHPNCYRKVEIWIQQTKCNLQG